MVYVFCVIGSCTVKPINILGAIYICDIHEGWIF